MTKPRGYLGLIVLSTLLAILAGCSEQNSRSSAPRHDVQTENSNIQHVSTDKPILLVTVNHIIDGDTLIISTPQQNLSVTQQNIEQERQARAQPNTQSNAQTKTSIQTSSRQKHQQTIALAYIDAPEIEQPFGKTAKDYLKNKLQDKNVLLRYVNEQTSETSGESASPVAAELFIDGININLDLLDQGLAWSTVKPPLTTSNVHDSYTNAQTNAMNTGSGLWALEHGLRVPPWQWRAQATEQREPPRYARMLQHRNTQYQSTQNQNNMNNGANLNNRDTSIIAIAKEQQNSSNYNSNELNRINSAKAKAMHEQQQAQREKSAKLAKQGQQQ